MHYWNWKAALLSAVSRGLLFFAVNLGAGLLVALAVFSTEFCLRVVMAGFTGSILQAIRFGKSSGIAIFVIPALSHSVEWFVHRSAGTPQLGASIVVSVLFSILSITFHLHAMRSGAFVVGKGSKSFRHDVSQLPGLLISFARGEWLRA